MDLNNPLLQVSVERERDKADQERDRRNRRSQAKREENGLGGWVRKSQRHNIRMPESHLSQNVQVHKEDQEDLQKQHEQVHEYFLKDISYVATERRQIEPVYKRG